VEGEAKNTVNHFCAPANTAPAEERAMQPDAFGQMYRVWIEEQNTRFEKNGLWCDELQVW
jgi:hypothetical protein